MLPRRQRRVPRVPLRREMVFGSYSSCQPANSLTIVALAGTITPVRFSDSRAADIVNEHHLGGKGRMSKDASTAAEARFYHKLRRTVKIWAGGEQSKANQYADYIMASPDLFMLLVRLSRDDRVSRANKARMAGAVAYFINPLDLIPELILGPPGLVDDIALAALVLHSLLETTDPSIVREHWEGSADILDLIRGVLSSADTMLGGPVWRRLLARTKSFVVGP